MPSDDRESLIHKIETHAGVVNHNALSDAEIIRGKELLCNEEHILAELELDIRALIARRDKQRERIVKFRVALAPHKRIPIEILSHIFSYCLPTDFHTTSIPPTTSQGPWVLGQVCSMWRQVSRNDPLLWGKAVIDLYHPFYCQNFPLICDLFPPVAIVSVFLRQDVEKLRTLLVPNLWRIQELVLQLHINTWDELWSIVSPLSFASLQSADFCIEGDNIALDGTSRWAQDRPFQLSNSLTTLGLKSPTKFSSALLSLDYPWTQITSLDVAGLEGLSLSTTFHFLQKCSSLESLIIKFNPYDDNSFPIHPLNIATLRYLLIQSHMPPRLVEIDNLWNCLSTLDLYMVDFQDGLVLHSAIKRCSRLKALLVEVPPKGAVRTIDGDLALPHLTKLTLSFIHDAWICRSLIVPMLTTLSVSYIDNVDISPVRDMLVSSGCSTHTFSLFNGNVNNDRIHAAGLRNILGAVQTAVTINIAYGFLEDTILHDIGNGELFPKAEELHCSAASVDVFVNMVEARMEWESRRGFVTLRVVGGQYFPAGIDSAIKDATDSRLAALARSYGIKCHLH